MGDMLLNGRPAEDFELAAIGHGRECDLARDRELPAGLLTEYRRPPDVPSRPVTELPVIP